MLVCTGKRESRGMLARMRKLHRSAGLGFLVIGCLAVGCGGDDSAWRKVEPPSMEPSATYAALWAFSETNVWVGGRSAWQYDGSAWTEHALPAPSDTAGVSAFWGFSPDNLWAIAHNGVYQWDGSGWEPIPNPTEEDFIALSHVWASGPADVWIANSDNSKVYHFDGTSWSRVTLQFVQAYAIWGGSDGVVWLTGPTDTYRYDGSWAKYEVDGFENDPRGAPAMWGAASDDIWASNGDFLHWNGSAWTASEAEDGYNSMWGFAADDIYAVGSRGAMAHFDGSRWEESSGHLSLRQNFVKVHGSSSENVWALAVDFDSFSGMVLRLR